MTEAPELFFFSGHGTSSAHLSPTTFKGRMDELSKLRDWVDSGAEPVLLLVGSCGAGKTRLATSYAQVLGRTEQSGDQLSPVFLEADRVSYAIRTSDGAIELS